MRLDPEGLEIAVWGSSAYLLDYDVRVTTARGRKVSLRNLAGRDFVRTVVVQEDVNTPSVEVTVTCQHSWDGVRLSPRLPSPVNVGLSDPLLEVDSRVEVFVRALNHNGVDFDWLKLFDGFIAVTDTGGEDIVVTARDRVFDLTQAYIAPSPNTGADVYADQPPEPGGFEEVFQT